VAGARPFAHYTNAALKARAARIAVDVEEAPVEQRHALYREVAELRDEMLRRLRGDDEGTAGVREPRRPPPGGDAASVARRSSGR
jgi:hypothetical protein